jgi:sugar phosphate isomerase/epimerase
MRSIPPDSNPLSRRSWLAASASLVSAAWLASGATSVPTGLQLFAIRDVLKDDFLGSVRSVAKLGYQDVEFYGTYLTWTDDYAKQVRKLLDETGMRCLSNHNEAPAFTGEGFPRALEVNHLLGARYLVMARPGKRETIDDWKKLADLLNRTAERLRAANMICGFHNHAEDFQGLEGTRPIDVLSRETSKDVIFELNVGTCLQGGGDPVGFINQNPGRVQLMHCTDWARGADPQFPPMIGQGEADWKKIFAAAEATGGIRCYLMQQEGTHLPPLEMAGALLRSFHDIHG